MKKIIIEKFKEIFYNFVNQNIQGGQQDGSSWNDAFPDLQQALAVSMDGDEIWVSQGTYYPTTTTDRSISFVLPLERLNPNQKIFVLPCIL